MMTVKELIAFHLQSRRDGRLTLTVPHPIGLGVAEIQSSRERSPRLSAHLDSQTPSEVRDGSGRALTRRLASSIH